jgi:four helix bundle protein
MQPVTKNSAKNRRKDIQDRAFSFACRIVRFCQFLTRQKGPAQVLSKQILRSGTSIGANLEEATGAQSKADFIYKCNIALKEARETHYWLRLLRETQVVTAEKLNGLTDESDELVAILTTIVRKSRGATQKTVCETGNGRTRGEVHC